MPWFEPYKFKVPFGEFDIEIERDFKGNWDNWTRFYIPLNDGKKLRIQTFNESNLLGKVKIINENGKEDLILTRTDYLPDQYKMWRHTLVSEAPNGFKKWRKIKADLEERLDLKLGNPLTIEEFLDDMMLLLKKVKKGVDKSSVDCTISHQSGIDYRTITKKLLADLPKKFYNYYQLPPVYSNPQIYSSDMLVPPAECKPHALRLELTHGCNYNACTFCRGHKRTKFKEKTLEEFKAHYREVSDALGDYMDIITRTYIGGGNALAVEQRKLEKVLKFLGEDLRKNKRGAYSGRKAIYARTDDILEKRRTGLERLRRIAIGLLLYWGVESGSDEVLKYVRKGTNLDDMLLAGYMANSTNFLELSIMIMPGLGGARYYDSHIKGTIDFLNEIRPKFVTFLGVNPAKTLYDKHMNNDEENRHLTQREMAEQLEAILEGVVPYGGQFGMFDPSIDKIGLNPVNFNLKFDEKGKELAIETCKIFIRSNAA